MPKFVDKILCGDCMELPNAVKEDLEVGDIGPEEPG